MPDRLKPVLLSDPLLGDCVGVDVVGFKPANDRAPTPLHAGHVLTAVENGGAGRSKMQTLVELQPTAR
jgi:hypothetical protein